MKGIQSDSDSTGNLPSAHSTHRAEKHIDGASPKFYLFPDRIKARMELPAAGEHVFAVEGIEKKRIRKVTERFAKALRTLRYWRLT